MRNISSKAQMDNQPNALIDDAVFARLSAMTNEAIAAMVAEHGQTIIVMSLMFNPRTGDFANVSNIVDPARVIAFLRHLANQIEHEGMRLHDGKETH